MTEPGSFALQPAAEHVHVDPKTPLDGENIRLRPAADRSAEPPLGGKSASAGTSGLDAFAGRMEREDRLARGSNVPFLSRSEAEGRALSSGCEGASTDERREFLASPTSVAEARRFVASTVRRWGLPGEVVQNAVLLVSEMVTNSVAAAPYERITVHVFCVVGGFAVEVWDPSPEMPARREPEINSAVAFDADADAPDPGGWGLSIIAALAERSGYRRERGGKTVFALLTVAL
ncbi:ATP-binding protein [Actinomadura sp. 9N407]|uniref:ATP-binding protein n=1 Tax=Actinomadura sp. 9N407 TaxID=3375154 RepID=UPI0037B34D4B